MLSIFIQFSLILLVVLVVSFLMRLLKQPLIIGYIISGILAGPFFLNLLTEDLTIQAFSEIGIAFLLFIVGLHLSPRVIKEVGKISVITGIGQIVFTSFFGYLIVLCFGFKPIVALYVSVALTFSSTIIIMKLLSDKDALEKLYGKISIGFLLVQDFVAIIILIIISSLATGFSGENLIYSTIIKGFVLLLVLFPFGYFVLPKLSNFFAKSQEFLFLFAVSWGMGLAALFHYTGFSIEIGALIAGISLSMSPYSYEIGSKLRPLRDFFIISFFLLLGSQMVFQDISNLILPIIVLSLFVLIGNPLIVMILMGYFGYSKKTSFMAGLTVAQISEFSLILIALGVKVGQLPSEILSFVTLIGLITIAGSTYMIMFSDKIYFYLQKFLYIFERNNVIEREVLEESYDYVLLGENRIGFSIMKAFIKTNKRYLIVDFNPVRVKKLQKKGFNCVYGDVSNLELIEELKIDRAKLVVSTIPEKEVNLMLINEIKKKNRNAIVIVTGRQISETYALYDAGADYVILPHFLGGEYIANLISVADLDSKKYKLEKNKQIKDLKARLEEGHEHPKTEKGNDYFY